MFLRIVLSLAILAPPAAAQTDGQVLYLEHCASCHGENLEGQPNWRTPDENGILPAPPHDETGHTWHHDDTLLFEYVKLGGQATLEARGVTGFTSGMEGFADVLDDDEIRAILDYIKSTWPEDIRDIQSRQQG